jgi:ABC-type lipoprotein export system ATPase subunit
MNFLSVKNITKNYVLDSKNLEVLKGTNLSIKQYESVAIMGKSGSGKSTFLQIIGGLDKPDNGEVIFKNDSIYSKNKNFISNYRNKEIGFIFQSYHLLPDLNVYENIILPSSISSNSHIKKKMTQLINELNLNDRVYHKPHELSGGEKQRVAIARSLINNPSLILADEPTGNLDDETSKIVLDYLFKAVSNHHKSIILVTHSKSVAKYCNKKYDLFNGELIEN